MEKGKSDERHAGKGCACMVCLHAWSFRVRRNIIQVRSRRTPHHASTPAHDETHEERSWACKDQSASSSPSESDGAVAAGPGHGWGQVTDGGVSVRPNVAQCLGPRP